MDMFANRDFGNAGPSHLSEPQCTWCLAHGVKLTDDHVFPRVIGGTLELSVPACEKCQDSLSIAEHVLGRQSIFAIYTVDTGPPGRDKRDPESGAIRTQYSLVRDPAGGYNEVLFKAGTELPITLPSIQIDTVSGNGRTNGSKPADIDRLVGSLDKLLRGRPDATGFVGEVPGRLLDTGDHQIASDPDFWPRVFLDLGGRLRIRARGPEEAEKFFRLLTAYLQAGAFRDHSSWTKREIVAGTVHHVRISYDKLSIDRIIAKIAYGVALIHFGPSRTEPEAAFSRARDFIAMGVSSDGLSVRDIALPGAISEWPDQHVAAVGSDEGRMLGLVSLYGACHVVDFGTTSGELLAIPAAAAVCRRKGGYTRLLEREAGAQVFQGLANHLQRLGPQKL